MCESVCVTLTRGRCWTLRGPSEKELGGGALGDHKGGRASDTGKGERRPERWARLDPTEPDKEADLGLQRDGEACKVDRLF